MKNTHLQMPQCPLHSSHWALHKHKHITENNTYVAYEGWDKRDKNANGGITNQLVKHRTETLNIKTMGRTKLMAAREIDLLYMSVWAWGWRKPERQSALSSERRCRSQEKLPLLFRWFTSCLPECGRRYLTERHSACYANAHSRSTCVSTVTWQV